MGNSKIIEKYPSLCYSCELARKPASESSREDGWVGCSLIAQEVRMLNGVETVEEIVEKGWMGAEEIGEGWVDLRSSVFGSKSGCITNLQLLTKKATYCKKFQKTIS